uniref:Kinesin motor domain-containing protein n=1 Tax=Tetranychus urticae TaxID=32264 RepID=T1KU84_TETUR
MMTRGSSKRPLSDSTNFHEPPAKLKSVVRDDDDDVGPKNIQVYIRVRPESAKELNSRKVVALVDDQSLIFDPPNDPYQSKKYKEIGKKSNKDLVFSFDGVFDEHTTNIQIYERAVKSFAQSLLDGFNCTIFAYGPTGSGKTYTMLGYNGEPGVMFYTAMELFHIIESKPSEEKFEVSASYFEIYNEKIYDLLTPSSQTLKVVDNTEGGVNILGLTVKPVRNADELIETLETGNQYRAQQATDANQTSSRSHAVFQLFLCKKKCSKGNNMIQQETKMCLVDLAGSERASIAYKEKRSKVLHREGGNINKSLLALGNCINALAAKCRKGRKLHISYRNSVLTRILSDSLGGNCRTAMIATVSPSSLSYDDTHNTLTYANRTKGINLALKRRSFLVGEPREQSLAMETLRQENIALAEKNIALVEKNIMLENEILRLKRMPANPISSDMSSIEILNSFKNILDNLFSCRLELRRKLLECESEMKKIELKYIFRKIQSETLDNKKPPKVQDVDDSKSARYLYHQKLHYEDRFNQLLKEVTDNEDQIRSLEDLIRSKVKVDDYFIDAFFEKKHMEAELQDKIVIDKHHSEVSYAIITQSQNWLETLDAAMKMNDIFFRMLDGLKKLSKEREEEYHNVVKKFEGKKSVVWRDDNLQKQSSVHWADIDNVLRLSSYTSTPRTPFRRYDEEGGLEIICAELTPESSLPSPPLPSLPPSPQSSSPLNPMLANPISSDMAATKSPNSPLQRDNIHPQNPESSYAIGNDEISNLIDSYIECHQSISHKGKDYKYILVWAETNKIVSHEEKSLHTNKFISSKKSENGTNLFSCTMHNGKCKFVDRKSREKSLLDTHVQSFLFRMICVICKMEVRYSTSFGKHVESQKCLKKCKKGINKFASKSQVNKF